MKKIKIIFTGYYGFDNLGDDMFGLVSVWGAEKFWKNSNTALLSGRGPTSKNITIRYALPYKTKFKGQGLLQSYWAFFRANFIILSGGSILNSPLSRLSPRRFAALLAKLNWVKMGAIGVSVGPFKSDSDSRAVEAFLQNFTFLALRDKASYEIACKMDLPYQPILASDFAFLLPEIEHGLTQGSVKKEIKIMGISLCHYERYTGANVENEKRREDAIYEVLKGVQKNKNIRFRFFVINGNIQTGDLELTQNMIKRLSLETHEYELIPYSSDTLKVYDSIASCDLIYSTRLHGAIFAAAANVPSLLIEYHRKCTDYLDDIGVAQEWRIGDMQPKADEIVLKITTLLQEGQTNFYPNREAKLALARENFTHPMILKEMM